MFVFLLAVISCFGVCPVSAFAKVVSSEQEIDSRHQYLMGTLNQVFNEVDLKSVEERDELFNSITSALENCTYGDGLKARFWSNFYKKCNVLIETAKSKNISYFLLNKALEDRAMATERKNILQDSLRQVYSEMSEKVVKEENELMQTLVAHFQSCMKKDIGEDVFSCEKLIESAQNEDISYFQVRYVVNRAISELKTMTETQIAKKSDNKAARQVSKP